MREDPPPLSSGSVTGTLVGLVEKQQHTLFRNHKCVALLFKVIDSRCAGETFVFIKLYFLLLRKRYNEVLSATSAGRAAPRSAASDSSLKSCD